MRTIMGTRRDVLAGMGAGAALLASGVGTVALAQDATQAAQGKVLKIGVLGVMRGPAASWGLVNRYCRRDHGRDLQRAGRCRDRRRAVPRRDHQHRRPARSQARHRRCAEPDEPGYTLHHRPQRRYDRRGHRAAAAHRQCRQHRLRLRPVSLCPAAAALDPRHDRVVPGKPDHLQLPEGEQRHPQRQLRGAKGGGFAQPA